MSAKNLGLNGDAAAAAAMLPPGFEQVEDPQPRASLKAQLEDVEINLQSPVPTKHKNRHIDMD